MYSDTKKSQLKKTERVKLTPQKKKKKKNNNNNNNNNNNSQKLNKQSDK